MSVLTTAAANKIRKIRRDIATAFPHSFILFHSMNYSERNLIPSENKTQIYLKKHCNDIKREEKKPNE